MQSFGEDRQLARLGAPQLSVDPHDVTQVEAVGQVPIFLADLILPDEELYPSGPVLNIDESQLAGIALEHDAARHANLGSHQFTGSLIRHPLPKVYRRLAADCR